MKVGPSLSLLFHILKYLLFYKNCIYKNKYNNILISISHSAVLEYSQNALSR